MLGHFFRGMAMGAADIVPGVSGGTIALLTGIYSRLVHAIKSIGIDTLKTWQKRGIAAAWQQIDGSFLLVLLSGMATSILLLAQIIHYCLEQFPIFVWSLFFGLVLASAIYIMRPIKWYRPQYLFLCFVGIVVAASISVMTPTQVNPSAIIIIGSGAVAICAMILPGISGSFILLLLGMYSVIIAAVKALELSTLALFAVGCIVGIMMFSRVLAWLLDRFHDATMMLLSGFMLGALVKLWPWREVLSTRVNSEGKIIPLSEWPVAPWVVESPQITVAIMACILGMGIVLSMAIAQKRTELAAK